MKNRGPAFVRARPILFVRTKEFRWTAPRVFLNGVLLTGLESSSCGYRSRTCSRVKAVSISHESRDSHVAAIPLINRRSIKYGVRVSDTDAFAHINERKRA